jgi:hypothetical protein
MFGQADLLLLLDSAEEYLKSIRLKDSVLSKNVKTGRLACGFKKSEDQR